MTASRKLAAIMFSDIVGYSATTQVNETEASRQIARHRSALEHLVSLHEGEVLQYYGDGSLVIFSSAFEAVECALDLLEELEGEEGVPVRIGIHLGEILFEDEQFIGDGINIASRIQSAATPCQLLVSEMVADMIRNKQHLVIRKNGSKRFKNIEHEMQLYSVLRQSSDTPISRPVTSAGTAGRFRQAVLALILVTIAAGIAFIALSDRPKVDHAAKSIAILPFRSLSSSEQDEFISAGIAEDIRHKLASIPELDVRSRMSSAYVNENQMSPSEIRNALDVDYILEGSLLRMTSKMQLNLSLIDANSSQLMLPLSYEITDPEDIFSIQDHVVNGILGHLQIMLPGGEAHPISDLGTTNFDAYQSYLLGRSYLVRSSSPDDIRLSKEYYQESIRLDSNFARAYAGLAEVLIMPAAWGQVNIDSVLPEAKELVARAMSINPDIDSVLPEAKELVARAMSINPDLAEVQHVLGTILEYETQFELAETAFSKAIDLDPSLAFAYIRMARVKLMLGKPNEAIDYVVTGGKVDPFSPVLVDFASYIYSRTGQYERALQVSTDALDQFPGHNDLLWNRGLVLASMGKYDEAIWTLESRSIPNANRNWLIGYCYAKAGYDEQANAILDYLLDKYDRAFVPPAMIASIYYGMGDLEKTHQWMRHEPQYFMLMFPFFRELWDDPQFADVYTFIRSG